jgi:NADH dehydrogenase
MIVIAGATGFVGGHLTHHLLSRGARIKGFARSEQSAQVLSDKGIEVIRGDITVKETLYKTLDADDFVIHLVGIIEEKGSATFRSIHVDGTAAFIKEAQRAGVRHFFYQSALGADLNSWSGYLRTKAEAEEIVRNSGLQYTIFRPSLIIGPWDGFTKKLIDMLKMYPVIPMPGEGAARFQPIFIKDWLSCVDKVIAEPDHYNSIFEIGGPEHISYKEIVTILAKAAGYQKPVFQIPMGIMKLATSLFSMLPVAPPITSDQLKLLETDNIGNLNAVKEFFGFQPVPYEEAIKSFI